MLLKNIVWLEVTIAAYRVTCKKNTENGNASVKKMKQNRLILLWYYAVSHEKIDFY